MMNGSLKQLCQALKLVFSVLNPKVNPIAFVLLVGRAHQGKSTLLSNSGLKHYAPHNQSATVFYHEEGVVVELCETWLNRNEYLLGTVLKQLNRVHSSVRITGVILCVDVHGMMFSDMEEVQEESNKHVQWLKRLISELDESVEVSLFLTKCDVLAGFVPFFQSEYPAEFIKPFGFSIESRLTIPMALKNYRQQYDRLIENLSRQVLTKLQTVRSSTQRTLIREFPMQMSSLKPALQGLIELCLKEQMALKGLYWMSADSREHHIDRVHQRIANDYAVEVPAHATGFRPQPAYFVQGAIDNVLIASKQWAAHSSQTVKTVIGSMLTVFLIALLFLGMQTFRTSDLLQQANQELMAYDMLVKSGQKPTAAAYHLSQALRTLQAIPFPMQTLSTVKQLQVLINTHSRQTIQHRFLPQLLQTLEFQMRSSHATQEEHYSALKTYLRMVNASYFSAPQIRDWFEQYWKKYPPQSPEKAKVLLEEVLSHPLEGIEANQQLVTEIRNYLNALPLGYFYYSLAKSHLSSANTPLKFPGLVLSRPNLPSIYTKSAFSQTMNQLLQIATQFQAENWVLERKDLEKLPVMLQQAYCADYVMFWKQFMKQSQILPIQNFHAGEQLAKQLVEEQTLSRLISLVRQNTIPDTSAYVNAQIFNENIASQFSAFQFLSNQAIKEIDQAIQELINFLTTLAIVHDHGATAFSFTKARFQGEAFSDSLTLLYQRSNSLPQPISLWVKQLSDSVWSLLIQQSRHYLNARWQDQVIEPYASQIAHRFPFDVTQNEEVSLDAFEQFFSPKGVLVSFTNDYVKPFLDTSRAQWSLKVRDGLMMPISEDMINELMRANVISNMFFQGPMDRSAIEFSLEKVNLDPVVSHLSLNMGQTSLEDDQSSHSRVEFHWPAPNFSLQIDSIEGAHYTLEEQGIWAFFKMLQKVNVLVDSEDSSVLQILFEVNGNAGRYLLKTKNQINPFSPGILDGFILNKSIV